MCPQRKAASLAQLATICAGKTTSMPVWEVSPWSDPLTAYLKSCISVFLCLWSCRYPAAWRFVCRKKWNKGGSETTEPTWVQIHKKKKEKKTGIESTQGWRRAVERVKSRRGCEDGERSDDVPSGIYSPVRRPPVEARVSSLKPRAAHFTRWRSPRPRWCDE